MSLRERGAMKTRWANKLRAEARRRNVDPDEFLAMTEDAREEARQSHPERVQQPQPKRASPKPTEPVRKSFEDVMRGHPEDDALPRRRQAAVAEHSDRPPA